MFLCLRARDGLSQRLYVCRPQSHEHDISGMPSGNFFKIGINIPLELKGELIYILVVKGQCHCVRTSAPFSRMWYLRKAWVEWKDILITYVLFIYCIYLKNVVFFLLTLLYILQVAEEKRFLFLFTRWSYDQIVIFLCVVDARCSSM